MENQQPFMTHIQKGLIISLVLILLSVGFYLAGLNQESWTQWIGASLFFIGIIWSCVYFGKQKNDMVTFGNTFVHGFKTTVVVTLITLVFTVIFITIFPDIKEQALEKSRMDMESKGNMTDDQIETAMGFTKKFFMVFMIVFLLFGNAIVGAIASLIGAAVTKKKPVNPLNQMSI